MNSISLRYNPINPDLNIVLPASKSISNRALILNALSYSPYEIENLSVCDDTRVTVKALDSNDNTFDIGAAGTAMRFLTAFLAKTMGEWTITGSERMKQRPIKLLVDALNSLGAKIEYIENEGFPPLKITGCALKGGLINLNGGISSQYISALMMIAPYMINGLTINLTGKVISVPYILMTKGMMEEFGARVSYDENIIDIRPQTYRPVRFKVESDWSAASYWFQIMSLLGRGKFFLQGLYKNSCQGDSKVASLFEQLGVQCQWCNTGVTLIPAEYNTERFEYDFTDQPDLAQTFAVTCCLKEIPFVFEGVESLKIKETDRVAALINELHKLGYALHEPAEGVLVWDGKKTKLPKNDIPSIKTYEDHRMAMAFAPVSLLRKILIEEPGVVSKSYPRYWEDLNLLSK